MKVFALMFFICCAGGCSGTIDGEDYDNASPDNASPDNQLDNVAPDEVPHFTNSTVPPDNNDWTSVEPVFEEPTPNDTSFLSGFTMLDGFNPRGQGKNNCGPAAVRMVLQHVSGTLLDEKPLADGMRKNDVMDTTMFGNNVGTSVVAVKWALNKHLPSPGVSATHLKDDSWEVRLQAIRDGIDAGMPVIAPVETPSRVGHWLVVIGYDLKGNRLLLANSGAQLGATRQPSNTGGYFEVVSFDTFRTGNAYGFGPLTNSFDQLLLKAAEELGLAVNVLVVLK